MADYFVVEELQSYLIAQGVGQAPSATPSAVLPPIWIQPRDGAALPGHARQQFTKAQLGVEIASITLVDTLTGAPAGEIDPWIEETFVDVFVRSLTAAPGKLIHRTITNLIFPNTTYGGRKLWTMNNLLVEYSDVWRGEQALPMNADQDVRTYDRVKSFRFGCRRKALAGLPYVP